MIFCPIYLCNTRYKIISKVVANRLKKVLKFIISNEQSGFAPNRSIVEGIIIAHEAIHFVCIAKADIMIVKLDIQKAYDKVRWNFLFAVLQKFGFCDEWIA